MKKAKYILAFLAILLASEGFSQIKKSTIRVNADVMIRQFENEKFPGEVWIAQIVGSETTYLKSNGQILNIVADELQFNGSPLIPTSIYHLELGDNETVIDVGFTVFNTTAIYFNGTLLKPTQWSGVSTEILTLNMDIKQYDFLTIIN